MLGARVSCNCRYYEYPSSSHVKGSIERFNGLAQDLKGFRDQYIEELKKVEANEKAQKSWPAYTDGTDKNEEMYTVSDLVTMYDMDALLSAPNLYDANIRGECAVNKSKRGYVNEKVCVSAGLAEEPKDGFGATERQALAQKILSNRRSNELLKSLQLEMRDGDGVDLVRQVARILDVQPSEVEKRCQKVIADRDSGKKTLVAKTESEAKPATSRSDSQ